MNPPTDLNELVQYEPGSITGRALSNGNRHDRTLYCMAKDTQITGHTASRPGMISVIEGTGTFSLKGRDINLRPHVTVYLEKGAPHMIDAHENLAFLLMLYHDR